MRLWTLCVLCWLCVLCTRGATYEQPDSNSSRSEDDFKNFTSPRDKRALGLILSGLAQVFGYNVSPVQLATLPNANPDPSADGGTTSSSSRQNAPCSNSTQPTSSTAATPRQRETIRFTGVLNFGNTTSLLNHLQEYENIFHGGGSVSNATQAPPSTTTLPSIDPRTPDSRQPLLVTIPLPAVRQPPLPEIPPQDIKLSYPQPYVIVQQGQMPVRNQTAKNKETQAAKDVQTSPPPIVYAQEPHWKKEYEDRLAELERKQEEQAERLRQQERYRNRVKDGGYNGEYEEKQKEYKDEDSGCKENCKANYSTEEDDSRERYEYSGQKGSQENRDDKYREYEKDVVDKDPPSSNYSYFNVEYDKPLPISVDDEQRRPEELRDSYGQLLNSRELIDDGFANYFGKLQQSLSNLYSGPEAPNSGEASREEEDSSSRENEDDGGSNEKAKEYDLPATNKYEEYSLEEDTDTKRKDVENSKEDSPILPARNSNRIPSNENRTYLNEQNSNERVDYSKFMPLLVPVRYLTAPEEQKRAEKSGKANKLSPKESRRPKKENVKPKIGIPERRSPKKLHEGEQKELQAWPAPFDFVLDSTIQTEVVTAKPERSIVKPNVHRKLESHGKGNGKVPRVEDLAKRVDSPERTNRNYPEDVNYRRYKEDLESRQRTSTGRTNPSQRISNRKYPELEDPKLHQRKEASNFMKRYKYISNDNNGKLERPNVKQLQSVRQFPNSMYSKRMDPLKRSTGTTDPVMGYYYSGQYPAEAPGGKGQDTPGFQLISQRSVPAMAFDTPVGGQDLFSFGGNYRLDRQEKDEKSIGFLEGDKKIKGNEAMIGLPVSPHSAYHHGETTKFASEPESKNEKVEMGYYVNSETVMRTSEQKQVNPNESIGYINFAHVL
ncbi:uncharacterized protein LOC122400552 [Colletes gigas]|uniref:uncharacterized protein LOC122400552 n=1 Tax=Colletes gigas TaxID=935657 RepID=UPI001C9A3100|nr:uncharacterized protein LOC122400552 [Colletes gigas]